MDIIQIIGAMKICRITIHRISGLLNFQFMEYPFRLGILGKS